MRYSLWHRIYRQSFWQSDLYNVIEGVWRAQIGWQNSFCIHRIGKVFWPFGHSGGFLSGPGRIGVEPGVEVIWWVVWSGFRARGPYNKGGNWGGGLALAEWVRVGKARDFARRCCLRARCARWPRARASVGVVGVCAERPAGCLSWVELELLLDDWTYFAHHEYKDFRVVGVLLWW